jgi:predicted DNA-binding transcriptional regulator AlpA
MAQGQHLRLREVQALLDDPRDSHAFREWVKREEDAGRFPSRIRLSERVHVWVRSDVEAWFAARPRGRARFEPAQATV